MHFGGYGVISVWQEHIYVSLLFPQLPGRVEIVFYFILRGFPTRKNNQLSQNKSRWLKIYNINYNISFISGI